MTDPLEVLEGLSKQTFRDFEVIIAREKGIVNAMNCALEKARGEIFVRIDDDVDLPPEWLEELLDVFDGPDVGGATGPTFVPMERRKNRDSIRIWEKPNNFLRWLTGCDKFNPAGIYDCGMVSYDSNYQERFSGEKYWMKCDHLEGTNWAMRTDLIREVGGFDPKFDGVAEWFDTDVEQKIVYEGFKLRYSTAAYLYHLLDFTEHYSDRFDGWGRIKNWLRYHKRHSKFHWKMVVFLILWCLYFINQRIEAWLESNKEKKWHW